MEGYREANPSEDVLIRDYTLADIIFACIGIGSEMSGGVREVRIEDCIFTHALVCDLHQNNVTGNERSPLK